MKYQLNIHFQYPFCLKYEAMGKKNYLYRENVS